MLTDSANTLSVIQLGDAETAVVTFPPLGPAVNVLMIWPRFPPSYWGLEGMMEMMPEKAHMPPLALATLAALLPPGWKVRLIDHAFDELRDEDILQADLVMISAMDAQRADLHVVLSRCRSLGRRTLIGGPYASREPEMLLPFADHVVVGEVDETFAAIAADFEAGHARRLYRVTEKPGTTRTPVPRFEILNMNKYVAMTIQFARGCPFQCEFCDIITIYGRRPRTKTPAQMIAELEALYRLGWRRWIFIVDDNFIGNHKAALELTRELARWQKSRNYPFSFYTEVSIDLSDRTELMEAMVEANFMFVFVGIESPSPESLREVKKFQNLRRDPLQQVRTIQNSGLWVTAGFIVGFDSDDAQIFQRQLDFIKSASIPWALMNLLQAPPTTPLYDRMQREGRLIDVDVTLSGACYLPNFRTKLAPETLFSGAAAMVRELYDPETYFRRTLESLENWRPGRTQHIPRVPFLYGLAGALRSLWVQGIRADYRAHAWRFLGSVVKRWWRDPARGGLALVALMSGHHFFGYARQLASDLEAETRKITRGQSASAPQDPSPTPLSAAQPA